MTEVMRHIHFIERNVPVQNWSANGIDLWPIVRIQLYFELFNMSTFSNAGQLGTKGPLERLLSYILSLICDLLQDCQQFLVNRKSVRYRAKKSDSIFLSDPSYVNYSGRYYQRFCDPLIADLERYGASSYVLTSLSNKFLPLQTPAMFVKTKLGILRKIGSVVSMAQVNRFSLSLFPGAEIYNKYVTALGVRNSILTERSVAREIASFSLAVSFYKKILKRVSPRNAFVVSYYDGQNMAFVHACRLMNIPVTDIQHGAINPLHVSYAEWIGVPDRGYNVLPNFFACWDKKAADVINQWGCAGRVCNHRGVVSGNRFIDIVRSDTSDDARVFEKVLNEKQKLAGTVKNVLLSVQFQYGLTPILQEILQSSPPEWMWWVRLHPMMSQEERDDVFSFLSTMEGVNFDISSATGHLLYTVLNCMDVHVTLNSSVVQEAAEFSVPSVILDEIGEEYYVDEIGSGVAFFEPNAVAAIARISVLKKGQGKEEETFLSDSQFLKEVGAL